MSFFVKYLAVAAICSIAVYVAPTFIRPDLYAEKTAPSNGTPAEPAWMPEEAAAAATPVAPEGPAARARPAAPRPLAAAASAKTPAVEEPAETGVEEVPEVIVENVRNYTPSTKRIRASGSDVTHWGVVIHDAPFYDSDGKQRADKLPGGTLVEQTASKRSSRGEMATCRAWRQGGWTGSYLVATADLIRFGGGREEVDADDVDNLCRYYGLNAAVERRKEELVQKAVAENPHYNALKAKAESYNEHRKRAEELTARRDMSKGAARSKIIAELAKLKNAEAREAAEVQKLTAKYEAWKQAHSSGIADPASDSVCKGYLRQMDKLRPRLAAFGL